MQTVLSRLARWPAWPRFAATPLTTEQLVLLTSLFCAVFVNVRFWRTVAASMNLADGRSWALLAALFVLVVAIHCLLFGVLAIGRGAKPVLALLLLVAAAASYFTSRYTVYFDPAMIANVLHTDPREASEWINASLLLHLLLFGALPAAWVLAVPLRDRAAGAAALARVGFLVVALAIALASLLVPARQLAPLIRNAPEVRYLITPANVLTSTLRHATARVPAADVPRLPVAADVTGGARWAAPARPLLLVIVVGETARAANWGLNGYGRDTTPQLAAAGGINFPDVTACGTSTEVSLPCMFAPFGREGYDARRVREHESLLHVLERAGLPAIWYDNQGGCKGVCSGLEYYAAATLEGATGCDGAHCLDEALLAALTPLRLAERGSHVVVLHQIGNHGPAYFRRYPPWIRRFEPACEEEDFGKCSRAQIVNAYDNALLYTDHVLGRAIAALRAQSSHDAALLYVSDHGESLGERGLYLHGMPYAIAPAEQTRVPMYLWMSAAFASRTGIDTACLRRAAGRARSHDDLFHSVLGMLRLSTREYRAERDFTAACRVR